MPAPVHPTFSCSSLPVEQLEPRRWSSKSGNWLEPCLLPTRTGVAAAAAAWEDKTGNGWDLEMWKELQPSSLIKALGGSRGARGGAENHQSQGGWRGGGS